MERTTLGILIAGCLGALPAAAQRGPVVPQPARGATLVTGVTAAVNFAGYQGPCPAPLVFTATITAAGPLARPISYQWVRSNGTKLPKRTVKMTGTSVTVTDRWRLGASGQMVRGGEQLHILSPNALVSNQATTSVLCR